MKTKLKIKRTKHKLSAKKSIKIKKNPEKILIFRELISNLSSTTKRILFTLINQSLYDQMIDRSNQHIEFHKIEFKTPIYKVFEYIYLHDLIKLIELSINSNIDINEAIKIQEFLEELKELPSDTKIIYRTLPNLQ